MTRKRRVLTRLVTAVMLAVPALVVVPSLSSAAPSQADLENAKARLSELNEDLSLLVEQYDEAKIHLDETRAHLAETQEIQADAEAEASDAVEALTDRASSAYMGAGSQLDLLLGAGSFADFSDRLEFLSQLQQDDADLAATAAAAGQRAEWAAEELAKAEAEQETLLAHLEEKQNAIEDGIKEQQSLIDTLGRQIAAAQERREEAAAAAAAAAQPTTTTTTTGGTGSFNPPPVNGTGATAAVNAAYSVIGTQYVWGGASPSGFDCSGLTLWSWAHGGVSLPHSSSAQYAATPRVDRGAIQPGDLLFFYSPIHHVAIYVGGGMMIDASHPGPGGDVTKRPVNWGSYVGAGRP